MKRTTCCKQFHGHIGYCLGRSLRTVDIMRSSLPARAKHCRPTRYLPCSVEMRAILRRYGAVHCFGLLCAVIACVHTLLWCAMWCKCVLTQAWSPLQVCRNNGGIFIKAAQFASNLATVPVEYREELGALMENDCVLPASVVQAVIEADTGKPLHQSFLELSPDPLATASLAQVCSATFLHHSIILSTFLHHPIMFSI